MTEFGNPYHGLDTCRGCGRVHVPVEWRYEDWRCERCVRAISESISVVRNDFLSGVEDPDEKDEPF